ncbi:NAD-dependent dehydratase [Desulfolithobacter dissulfuricans]|uniref:UDP-glucose 4-epimerase n=1 Tax=Desulfolithobacter dissulfuricans TaxID=2795293 RepID=A0A915XLG4_9BACT|nr:NAD-dependent epimerase/dehydratase family protein [Desulfolithobacter dissulfuricans]BCO09746.1 NAD-dependent dehydratase [Desulfolithobacter dissulfuricans]
MRVLVLGGNGFIGSHVVDHLLAKGVKVRIFDRSKARYRSSLNNVDYRLAPFDDVPALAESLEGIDVVYHFVSTTVPSTSNLDPISDIGGNLVGTVRLLQLMVQKRVRRIVFLSSGGTVYGIPDVVPIPESHPLRPVCSYGVVKIAIENYLHMFGHLHGLEYVILRASNPYGERQGHKGVQGVIGTFAAKVLAGEPIEVWGDGSIVRDFIYIGDLADLCVRAGCTGGSGIVNAGSGIGYSIKDVINVLSKVSSRDVQVCYREGRPFDVPRVVLDITKAREWFDWEPRIDLNAGIGQTWQWLEKITQ